MKQTDQERLRDPQWLRFARVIMSDLVADSPDEYYSIPRRSMLVILDELDRLRQLTGQVDPAMRHAPRRRHERGTHFKRITCTVCGEQISSAGFARRPHENGRTHQAALTKLADLIEVPSP